MLHAFTRVCECEGVLPISLMFLLQDIVFDTTFKLPNKNIISRICSKITLHKKNVISNLLFKGDGMNIILKVEVLLPKLRDRTKKNRHIQFFTIMLTACTLFSVL